MAKGEGWMANDFYLTLDDIKYEITHVHFEKVIFTGPGLDRMFDANRSWEDIISEIRLILLRQKCI